MKLTREHVIPVWLHRHTGGEWGGEKGGTFRGTHLSSVGIPLSNREIIGDKHKVKLVCRDCNHGWMSRLETRFATLLPRLELGLSPKQFDKKERFDIALWITKTAIIAQHSSNYRQILPEDFPRRLCCGKALPGGIKVFIGRVQNKIRITWIQTNFNFFLFRTADRIKYDLHDLRYNNFIFSMSIKGTIILFAWRSTELSDLEIFSHKGISEIYPHPAREEAIVVLKDLYATPPLLGLRPR